MTMADNFYMTFTRRERKQRAKAELKSTVRYGFLKQLIEWCESNPGEGTPDITGFWLVIGGKRRISYKCFYDLHYTRLRDEGYVLDYLDPRTGARALIITSKARDSL